MKMNDDFTKFAYLLKFCIKLYLLQPRTSPVLLLDSTIAPNIETQAKSGVVSALAQQFEMNANKQSMDQSISHPISGNKWSPKGGPKPKELPQLLPTVEFKTTPAGGKYKKIDYEVIDDNKLPKSEQQDSSSLQYSFEKKEEENFIDRSSSEPKFISPEQQKEQITLYEYDSQKISRRTDEIPSAPLLYEQKPEAPSLYGQKPESPSLYEQKSEKLQQDLMPHRRDWTEERKTEERSSTPKGAWQYDMKHFPPFTTTPSAQTTTFGLWTSTESRDHDVTSHDEKPKSKTDTVGSTPSSTILVKQDQEGRMLATETWDTKRQGASYSTASTLEKTRELDEEVSQKDVRQHSPIWAIIKSTRHDDSKEGEVCF
ncbi:unnamed protein product [Cercopithifilaria johnstoni]|uniref:Uncharacterized protein n=1 Tax=Cercopithifilaria johnstoni TaxID=2874296 RepID=A0A8J2Q6Y8_9BILA|nr:unnamed protein product [Cercopithifilaria johnstoni]